ncbi:MAG: NitT/TauT family transport system substrate-binding [Geobacteraceae bacterium]|nr:MAG: NitT/TauT family transport system substrate-binding [Geobacteraceae bacterium]
MSRFAFIAGCLMVTLFFSQIGHAAAGQAVRIGHFPNMTHAQPLVGRSLGTFEKRIGSAVDWKVFNAGPSEMEALIAGQIDIAYVGPNPAVNAFLRSKGKALRIIAGAASGGAALVVPGNASIKGPQDFKGKRIASPELGNTQDVALRHWLKSNGLTPGRDVPVSPIKNPDILMLFQQKKLAGAWVPEPWVSRLINEGGGRIMLDERSLWPEGKFPTAVVVVRTEFYEKNREQVRRFLEAHVEVTEWMQKNPADARKRLNEQLGRLAGKPLPPQILTEAFSRVLITYDPLGQPLLTSARWAHELGYLPRNADLSGGIRGLFDLTLLNDLLKKRSLPALRGN